MKNLLILTVLFLAPQAARASDLSRDLQVPFDAMSNPFHGVEAKAVSESAATELKALLERCVFTPGKFNGLGVLTNELETGILPACASELGLNADKNILTVRALDLEIVSWDGSHSDGGDEQAIGVYSSSGDRLAVYPSLFADGNVLDGLAYAVGAKIRVTRR
jgi:hypothetical protein